MNPEQVFQAKLVNRIGELEYLLMQALTQNEYLRSVIDGNRSATPGASEVQLQAGASEAPNGEESR
jgi:hypothetical protein